MDKIIQVHFDPEQEYQWGIEGLIQWDQGQKLQISGLDISSEIVEVHFSLHEHCGVAKRMLGTVINGVIHTDIPPFILEGPNYCSNDTYSAYAWVYVSDEDSAETIRKMEFEIKARPKPEEYVKPEELEFLQQLEAHINKKLDKSGYEPNKYLATDGEGNVVEKDVDVSEEVITKAVEDYLDENPVDGVSEEDRKRWDSYQERIDKLYVDKPNFNDIPTKTSDLENDSDFVTSDAVYSKNKIDEMFGEILGGAS